MTCFYHPSNQLVSVNSKAAARVVIRVSRAALRGSSQQAATAKRAKFGAPNYQCRFSEVSSKSRMSPIVGDIVRSCVRNTRPSHGSCHCASTLSRGSYDSIPRRRCHALMLMYSGRETFRYELKPGKWLTGFPGGAREGESRTGCAKCFCHD